MNFLNVLNEIKDIPHLPLNFNFDVERLKNEAENASFFVPYESSTPNPKIKEKYIKAWSGRVLYGSEENDLSEFVGKPSSPKITDLGKQCPYIFECISKITNIKHRVRLMSISGHESLVYHSHVQTHNQPPYMLTLHIPIIVPERFEYRVTHKSNIDFRDDLRLTVKDPNLVFAKTYEPGVPTIFNSYHYHNVVNQLEQARISVMFYSDLRDDLFLQNVSDAMINYDGEKVRPYE